MRKKTLFVGIVIGLSIQSAFALTLEQITDNAILLTKREANYGRYTIDLPNGYTSTIQFLNYELEQYEGDFKQVVSNTYNQTLTGSTGFIQQFNAVNRNWIDTYNSGSVSSKERAKAKFWTNIYQNFLVFWGNPNTNTNNNTGVIYNGTRTYTEISHYSAINGKTYTIRRSNDGLYWYRQGSGKYFSSESSAKTYVELQNRLIYTAPNGRRYGIFKVNNRYYFNRDEGSISVLSWISVQDTQAYINQHNQPTAACQQAQNWRCY